MRVSIVSPYYNRKGVLYKTLKVLSKSNITDFEYIIVDDGSATDQRIEDFVDEFNFVKVFRIEPENKKHINPCIPFNMGISKATGDFVILQSPECMHMGDVLEYVVNNLKSNQYMVFSCFSLSEISSKSLNSIDFSLTIDSIKDDVIKNIGGLTTNSAEGPSGRYNTWFSHSVYRRCYFNFLVALTKIDLYDLGGFDERFAFGHAYDDTDFAARVLKKGMYITMTDDPFCLHQYHRSFLTEVYDFHNKERLNRSIYEEALCSSNYRINNSFINKEIT